MPCVACCHRQMVEFPRSNLFDVSNVESGRSSAVCVKRRGKFIKYPGWSGGKWMCLQDDRFLPSFNKWNFPGNHDGRKGSVTNLDDKKPAVEEGTSKLGGGNSNIFVFSPKTLGFHDPIWLAHIFQLGWFNHQLEKNPTSLGVVESLKALRELQKLVDVMLGPISSRPEKPPAGNGWSPQMVVGE